MKTTKFKAIMILVGLLIVNIQTMSAGVVDKVQKFAGDQLSNFNTSGLLVIGGIVGASLIIYIITNHVIKEKDEAIMGQNSHVSSHNHHRHHHTRHIVKKTS